MHTDRRFKINIRDIVIMIIGGTLIAAATKYVYDPTGLVTGGVSGLSIILKWISGSNWGYEIPLWLSSIVLNIPIFIFAIFTDGIRSVVKASIVWAVITVELYLFPEYDFMPQNLLLVAIYGGVITGVGIGLLLHARTTSGGTDMLSSSLHHFIRSVSVGRILQIIDWTVVACGAIVFGIEKTLFAVISVFIVGKVIDGVLNLGKKAKMALIISSENDKIANDILYVLDRGVTGLNGRGMYTKEDRTVLLCIGNNRDMVEIKDIVKKYDKRAFVIVNDVNEAMGEGFAEEWYKLD
ncbi:MAG: YitT family protein [Lachnospiraceae bacterium]|nr:YitT family protein [Lachnospiraceae bacterium]